MCSCVPSGAAAENGVMLRLSAGGETNDDAKNKFKIDAASDTPILIDGSSSTQPAMAGYRDQCPACYWNVRVVTGVQQVGKPYSSGKVIQERRPISYPMHYKIYLNTAAIVFTCPERISPRSSAC